MALTGTHAPGSPGHNTDHGLIDTAINTTLPDAINARYGPGNEPVKKIVLPHTWAISGEVVVASGDDGYILPFFIPSPAGQTVRLLGVRYRINSGTSATIEIRNTAGTAITGLTGIAVTTTTGQTAPTTPPTFADGDRLHLVVTAVSGVPTNMTVTAYLEYTV